jgi:hypothetical protein
MVPEKLPEYIAGEGFRTFPTMMTAPVTKRLATEAKAFLKMTVFPEVAQEKLLIARELTVMERQVAAVTEVKLAGKVMVTLALVLTWID